MTNKEIRDEAMLQVMWRVANTNNDVTRYISDAVAQQIVIDERGSEWIPVKERLPEPHVDVLVAVIDIADGTDDASTFVDCLIDNDGTLTWSTFNGAQESVPAWMPLPEPYSPVN